MKTPSFKSIVRLLSILAMMLGCVPTLVAREEKREEKSEAVKQLEEARKAKDPVEHLEKAKKDLEKTGPKKRNQSEDATTRIDRAIEAHKKGDHKQMEAFIKEALEELHKASERRKR